MNDGSWSEYKRLVVSQLQTTQTSLESLDSRVAKLEEWRVEVLAKVTILAALVGSVPTAIMFFWHIWTGK